MEIVMKTLLTVLLVIFCVLCAIAQPEPQDSIAVQELQEIVIEAPKVKRKAYIDVYYPSESAVANSKNGMQ